MVGVLVLLFVQNLVGQTVVEGLNYQTQKPVSVEIRDGKISKIKQIEKLSDENHALFIAPGLIDNQVNGYAGVSFCFDDGSSTRDNIRKVTEELWKRGVTTYLPTLTTNSIAVLLKNISLLTASRNDPSLLGSMGKSISKGLIFHQRMGIGEHIC